MSINFKEKINQNLEFKKIHLIPAFVSGFLLGTFGAGLILGLFLLMTTLKASSLLMPFLAGIYGVTFAPYAFVTYLPAISLLIYFKKVNVLTLIITGLFIATGLLIYPGNALTSNLLGGLVYCVGGVIGGFISYHWFEIFSKE